MASVCPTVIFSEAAIACGFRATGGSAMDPLKRCPATTPACHDNCVQAKKKPSARTSAAFKSSWTDGSRRGSQSLADRGVLVSPAGVELRRGTIWTSDIFRLVTNFDRRGFLLRAADTGGSALESAFAMAVNTVRSPSGLRAVGSEQIRVLNVCDGQPPRGPP